MTEEMWNALDAIEDCINRLLAIRDVVSLNTLPNEEIVKLIGAMVEMFSEKQKIVWEQYRNEREQKEYVFDDIEMNEIEYNQIKGYQKQVENLENLARKLTNDYIALETKYNKLALYDTRDIHIEDLNKENTELIQNNEKLNNQIRELVIQNEFYRDQTNLFRDNCERWEEKYARLKEDYDNLTNTVRTVSQHPSHD